MAGGSVSLGSQPAFLQDGPCPIQASRAQAWQHPGLSLLLWKPGNIFSVLLDIFLQTACALGKVPC